MDKLWVSPKAAALSKRHILLANSVLRALRRVADGQMFRLCPVRVFGTSAAIASKSGSWVDAAFRSDPAPTALMRIDEEPSPCPKGAGQPEPTARCRAGTIYGAEAALWVL